MLSAGMIAWLFLPIKRFFVPLYCSLPWKDVCKTLFLCLGKAKREEKSAKGKMLILDGLDETPFPWNETKKEFSETAFYFSRTAFRFQGLKRQFEMSIFQTRKPRRFEYKPRFYDPDKEELERLKAKYGQSEGESYKRRIDFRSAMKEKKDEKLGKPVSALKIILIASIVAGLLYFLLFIVETWQ